MASKLFLDVRVMLLSCLSVSWLCLGCRPKWSYSMFCARQKSCRRFRYDTSLHIYTNSNPTEGCPQGISNEIMIVHGRIYNQEAFLPLLRPSKLPSICVAIVTFTPSSLANARTSPGLCWNQRPAWTASMPDCITSSARLPVLISRTAVPTSLFPVALLILWAQCTWYAAPGLIAIAD